MQFLSLTGPKVDIDRVIDQYLSKYEIHLENALSELQSVADLTPFLSINPYKTTFQHAEDLIRLIDGSNLHADPSISLEEAIAVIEDLDQQMDSFRETDIVLEQQRTQLQSSLDLITPFTNLDFDISTQGVPACKRRDKGRRDRSDGAQWRFCSYRPGTSGRCHGRHQRPPRPPQGRFCHWGL